MCNHFFLKGSSYSTQHCSEKLLQFICAVLHFFFIQVNYNQSYFFLLIKFQSVIFAFGILYFLEFRQKSNRGVQRVTTWHKDKFVDN